MTMSLAEYLDAAPASLENTVRTLHRKLRESDLAQVLDNARGNARAVLEHVDAMAADLERRNKAIPDDLDERREALRVTVNRIFEVTGFPDTQKLLAELHEEEARRGRK